MKRGIKLFIYLFPVFCKSGRLTVYEKIIPVNAKIRDGYKEFLTYKNYFAANGVRFCINESIDKSDEFMFTNMNHFSKKAANMFTDEIIDLLENSDFFDDNYVNTITPDVKKAEFNYLNDLIGKTLVGINEYAAELAVLKKPGKTGAIVMNCNPCTNGHMHLIRTAAAQVDNLFIFVVEEDRSDFPFEERIALVRENCNDLTNVTVLPSGKFIISTLTFPEYFMKAELLPDEKPSVTLDVTAFAVKIAPALGITERFVGEEPFDPVTREYNRAMASILPFYGVEFTEIPRTESGGTAISASRVRKLLKEGDFEAIKPLVPEATYNYLYKNFSKSS
jgi:[citrate (pro-3S)-lyase] ligase